MTGLAVVHNTALVPGKMDILAPWILDSDLFPDVSGGVAIEGAFRLVDRRGEVGVECFILRDDSGSLWHIPVTYRANPLVDAVLIGTLHHGVLGKRYIYYGASDPVYKECVEDAIRGRFTEAEISDGRVRSARCCGTGLVKEGLGDCEVIVARGLPIESEGLGALVAFWHSGDRWLSSIVATLRMSS